MAPTDSSEASVVGERFAVALAKMLRANVELLHVFEPLSQFAGMEAVVIAREDLHLTALVRGQPERLAEQARESDLHFTSYVRSGNPIHEIA
jgi:nucleotide-binding universal stress UspA family protein